MLSQDSILLSYRKGFFPETETWSLPFGAIATRRRGE